VSSHPFVRCPLCSLSVQGSAAERRDVRADILPSSVVGWDHVHPYAVSSLLVANPTAIDVPHFHAAQHYRARSGAEVKGWLRVAHPRCRCSAAPTGDRIRGLFAAVHMSRPGTPRQFAALHQFGSNCRQHSCSIEPTIFTTTPPAAILCVRSPARRPLRREVVGCSGSKGGPYAIQAQKHCRAPNRSWRLAR
jgi:hypothetical protein